MFAWTLFMEMKGQTMKKRSFVVRLFSRGVEHIQSYFLIQPTANLKKTMNKNNSVEFQLLSLITLMNTI